MKRLHEKYAEMIQKLLNTESGLYELMYFQNIGGLCLYHWYLSYSPLHDSLSQPDCLRSTYTKCYKVIQLSQLRYSTGK